MNKLLWLAAVPCSRCRRPRRSTATRSCKKVDRNLEPESYEMYRKLINIEPDGAKKEFVLYSVKKGRDKMVALFLAPPSDKGRATLRLGDNMWLYIPDVGKPMRITSLQSVIGGVFNNADILRVDYGVEYNVEAARSRRTRTCCRSRRRPAKSPTTG